MGSRVASVALETSCEVGGVALGRGPEVVAGEEFEPGMRHARDLVPALGRLARERALDLSRLALVMVDLGPGSFTGVRVGVATAKALHLAARCQVVGVVATDVVAAAAERPPAGLCVVVDATRGELYAARYRPTQEAPAPAQDRFRGAACTWERTWGPGVVPPADLVGTLSADCCITGGALRRYGDEFRSAGFALAPEGEWLPRVRWVYALGWERYQAGLLDDPYTLEPIYLRLPAAEERWREKHRKR